MSNFDKQSTCRVFLLISLFKYVRCVPLSGAPLQAPWLGVNAAQCQDLLCFFPPSPMDLATLAHLSGVPFLGTAATLRALLASLASTLQLSL